MNLFLPEEKVCDSVIALDDKRLNKQIVECKTMLSIIDEHRTGGYANHPVTKYYSNYPAFLYYYGLTACLEYKFRFGKHHACCDYFYQWADKREDVIIIVPLPFYAEGAKGTPGCIRTTDNAIQLFRDKLCYKWDTDKYPPKWTNREPPIWYKNNYGKNHNLCLEK